jgi:hypothetical protein
MQLQRRYGFRTADAVRVSLVDPDDSSRDDARGYEKGRPQA